MRPRILLVNPPIYDFAAYDFWLKPYGLLNVAGQISPFADIALFDYLDRNSPDCPATKSDQWQRGPFPFTIIDKPAPLADIPRHYRRFGLKRELFNRFLKQNKPFDFVLIQSVMTYWYPGIREVIEDVRAIYSNACIVIGGFYATVCPEHAKSLGADLVISGSNLLPLKELLNIPSDSIEKYHSPYWQAYNKLDVGVMKLTEGCPFNCSYCAADMMQPVFKHRPLDHCIADLKTLLEKGVKNIAFYDDALLYQPEQICTPFFNYVLDNKIEVNFHTPNALHARFITEESAKLMVKAGFKTFYLGFESVSESFQKQTGSKVLSEELKTAVEYLRLAGAKPQNIIAYEIVGHPDNDSQQLEESIRFAHSLGIRIMLADFSPIPRTIDGEKCRKWVDLDEPLNHNKTAFPIRNFGFDRVNLLKDLCRKLNRK